MHMSLLVITPSETEKRYLANLSAQDISYYEQVVEQCLEDGFDDYLDWYVIGGRWCFQLKESFDELEKRMDVNSIDTYTNDVKNNIMLLKDVRDDFKPYAIWTDHDDYWEMQDNDFDDIRIEYADRIVILVDIHN